MTLDAYIVTPTPHQFGLGKVQGMKFYTSETLSGKLKVLKPVQSKTRVQFNLRIQSKGGKVLSKLFCVGTNAFQDFIKKEALHNICFLS